MITIKTLYTRLLLGALLLFIANTSVMAQSAADAITGDWYTQSNEAKINIYKKDGKYFGKIVWLEKPNYPDGSPKIDKHNPDPVLRSRKIMGLDLLTNFEYEGEGEYGDGKIYDPKKGDVYSCNLELVDGNTLKVTGYIGFSFIGRTVVWTRAN